MKKFKSIRNERGSMSIEFLGILPFYFLFFILLWQVVASGYAVLCLKTAANDGAQAYALSGSYSDAVNAVNKSIGKSSVLIIDSVEVCQNNDTEYCNPPSKDSLFDLKISASHPLEVIPKKWRPTIDFEAKATGKVLLH
ncbi:pilus assembly protein [Sporosarcina sp. ACRSL]|uniref:TadE/TadG family type IV pilus assembly protein n=1 Tax=Sporosarcina sp. ACRSL TaxID=2918215 RepID=UPI001EF6B485|nr:pilus assembly protein [Sporosarcina sp. ACRSL]